MTLRKLLVFLVMLLMSGGLLAGGGKVRGDEGQGGVVQVQVFPAETPGVPPWFVNEQESSDEETSEQEFELIGESF